MTWRAASGRGWRWHALLLMAALGVMAATASASQASCSAPCWRTGLVYQSTGSQFTPGAAPRPYAMDLYRSAKTPKRRAPVVVLMHGGGFVGGTRQEMALHAAALARAGYLVATIDYRLVPAELSTGLGIVSSDQLVRAASEAQQDAVRAMQWIRSHARTLGATRQRNRYAVGGYSAGAITALRVGFRSGDLSTPTADRWRVGAVIAISGSDCGDWTLAYGCTGAYDARDAPTVIFTGETDSIVPATWSLQTCTAARDAGARCRAYEYPGVDHFWPAGVLTGSEPALTPQAPGVLPTAVRFLRRMLPPER